MATVINTYMREQLIERRTKLEGALAVHSDSPHLASLLKDVDGALARIEDGSFGICEACQDPIEAERLIADPLLRLCLDHLEPGQQRALERDLELASKIQTKLLPEKDFHLGQWKVTYHYDPAGLVSGDYIDLVSGEDQALYFMFGDVSGKGVAASMLMSHLHAMFRTLISVNLPIDQMVERASRLFCESTLPNHFATLVCGRADGSGDVEICNAGHLPPIQISPDEIAVIEATGMPLGAFCESEFSVNKVRLVPGDSLILYTDGLTEAQNATGKDYGLERVVQLARDHGGQSPKAILDRILEDLEFFRSGETRTDDLSIMAIQRV